MVIWSLLILLLYHVYLLLLLLPLACHQQDLDYPEHKVAAALADLPKIE